MYIDDVFLQDSFGKEMHSNWNGEYKLFHQKFIPANAPVITCHAVLKDKVDHGILTDDTLTNAKANSDSKVWDLKPLFNQKARNVLHGNRN